MHSAADPPMRPAAVPQAACTTRCRGADEARFTVPSQWWNHDRCEFVRSAASGGFRGTGAFKLETNIYAVGETPFAHSVARHVPEDAARRLTTWSRDPVGAHSSPLRPPRSRASLAASMAAHATKRALPRGHSAHGGRRPVLAECCFLPRVRKRLRLFCFPEESVRVPGLDAELCAMIGLRGVGALSSMTQALRVGESGLTSAATSAIKSNSPEWRLLGRAAAEGDARVTPALALALGREDCSVLREVIATWLGKVAAFRRQARSNERASAALSLVKQLGGPLPDGGSARPIRGGGQRVGHRRARRRALEGRRLGSPRGDDGSARPGCG